MASLELETKFFNTASVQGETTAGTFSFFFFIQRSGIDGMFAFSFLFLDFFNFRPRTNVFVESVVP